MDALLLALLPLLALGLAGLRRVPAHEVHVLLRHGRYRRALPPGLHWVVPGLDRIGQRFLRAAKQRQQVALGRYHALRGQVFPGGHLQERHEGFVALLADQGLGVVDELLKVLDPLEKRFSVLVPAHT